MYIFYLIQILNNHTVLNNKILCETQYKYLYSIQLFIKYNMVLGNLDCWINKFLSLFKIYLSFKCPFTSNLDR